MNRTFDEQEVRDLSEVTGTGERGAHSDSVAPDLTPSPPAGPPQGTYGSSRPPLASPYGNEPFHARPGAPAPRPAMASVRATHATSGTWQEEVVLTTIRLLWRHKVLCMFVVFLTALTGALNVKLHPYYYIATARIYPPSGGSPLGGLAIPGVAGLVGSLGLGNSGNSQFPIYEKVIYSKDLIKDLLQTSLEPAGYNMTVMEYLNVEAEDSAMRTHLAIETLKMKITYDVDSKLPVATIGCQDTDPKVAALIVNRALDLLNRFDIAASTNKASERRRFIEGRLKEAALDLAAAEEKLENFRAENLRIGNAPNLLLQQARLQREIEIEQQIYLTLRKEMELTRIEERRAVSVVNILDRATPPAVPAGPQLVRSTILTAFMGTMLVVLFFVTLAVQPMRQLRRLGVLTSR